MMPYWSIDAADSNTVFSLCKPWAEADAAARNRRWRDQRRLTLQETSRANEGSYQGEEVTKLTHANVNYLVPPLALTVYNALQRARQSSEWCIRRTGRADGQGRRSWCGCCTRLTARWSARRCARGGTL